MYLITGNVWDKLISIFNILNNIIYFDINNFSYFNFSLRYALQQLSEQNDMMPITELEYFTPSTRLLNSFLHELQFEYIWNIYTCHIINSLFTEKVFSGES